MLPDLGQHATAIHRSLRAGGVYFAVMGVHTASPLMVDWHAANRDELDLPALYEVDDVVATFRSAGFDPAIARLAIRFMPITDGTHVDRSVDWLTYYTDHKLLFRFTRSEQP